MPAGQAPAWTFPELPKALVCLCYRDFATVRPYCQGQRPEYNENRLEVGSFEAFAGPTVWPRFRAVAALRRQFDATQDSLDRLGRDPGCGSRISRHRNSRFRSLEGESAAQLQR